MSPPVNRNDHETYLHKHNRSTSTEAAEHVLQFSSETSILFYRRSTTGVSFIQIFDSRIIERLTLVRMLPLHTPHSTQSHYNHIWYISNRIYLIIARRRTVETGIPQDMRNVLTRPKNYMTVSVDVGRHFLWLAPIKARAPHAIPLPVLVTVV